MSILKSIFNIKDIKSPIFLKDFNKNIIQINELMALKNKIKNQKKNYLIGKDIEALKIGASGEENVYYELKNSYIPMLCLHNIRIESEGNTAQLDFILITHYFIMILETKKLSGDININGTGEFTRITKNAYGKVIKKEGIYSPISQNERHARILKDYLIKNKITRNIPIYSPVIIANQKSIINKYKAPYIIKNKIFKYDQLTSVLNKELSKCKKENNISESKMYKIANFLIENHKEKSYNLYKKYSIVEDDFKELIIDSKYVTKKSNQENFNNITNNNIKIHCPQKQSFSSINNLRESLRKYRYKVSLDEKVKPYYIFNDKVLDELVSIKPKTSEELLNIKGLGPVKVSKYGMDILDIIKGFKK